MLTKENLRINYYVGAMLAQGGNLWIDGTKIVFSPTSAVDRALGAQDVEIPFIHIRGVEYKGALSRSFHIKTDDKVHKFEGSQAKKFLELLGKALPNKELMPPLEIQNNSAAIPPKLMFTLVCEQCAKSLQPGYSFCPHCGTRPKSVCNSCHRAIDPNWVACAFCGWKFITANAQQRL